MLLYYWLLELLNATHHSWVGSSVNRCDVVLIFLASCANSALADIILSGQFIYSSLFLSVELFCIRLRVGKFTCASVVLRIY